jgi:hypothetical protein
MAVVRPKICLESVTLRCWKPSFVKCKHSVLEDGSIRHFRTVVNSVLEMSHMGRLFSPERCILLEGKG